MCSQWLEMVNIKGGLEVKNHKTSINFVSTINFFSFPVLGNFDIKLLLVLCAFQ